MPHPYGLVLHQRVAPLSVSLCGRSAFPRSLVHAHIFGFILRAVKCKAAVTCHLNRPPVAANWSVKPMLTRCARSHGLPPVLGCYSVGRSNAWANVRPLATAFK